MQSMPSKVKNSVVRDFLGPVAVAAGMGVWDWVCVAAVLLAVGAVLRP